MASIIPIVLILLIMYLLLVRPQQQRVRRQREMVQALQVGSEVQTIGGIIGHIVELDAQHIRLEVAPGIVMTFARAAVANVLQSTDAEEEYDGEEHEGEEEEYEGAAYEGGAYDGGDGDGDAAGDAHEGGDEHPAGAHGVPGVHDDEPGRAGDGATGPTAQNRQNPHDAAREAGNRPLGAGEESDEGRP